MPISSASALRKDTISEPVTMQHRHFATIAGIIRDLHQDGSMTEADVHLVAQHFATALGETNPRFDRGRFLKACSGEA